jgi:hypothetical protein
MRRFMTIAIATAALFGAAQAERRVAPVRPYVPVAVTLPERHADADLAAFRQELAKVAEARVYADLARLTVARGFFWGRDFGNRFDPHRPGVDNLAAALRLEHDGGAGWTILEKLVAEAGALPLESHPGVVCAPGPPRFDTIAFDQLVDATRTAATDWAYTRAPDIAVRAAPHTDAAALEILGLHFVRVLERGGAAGGWIRVAAPGGAVGFVAPDTLRALNAPRLCYRKDSTGAWQIAGFIDRGD